MIDHHQINEQTRHKINLKKHEAHKRKFAPKTKAQRLKSTFYILTAVWVLAQVCSALLASTGFIHYAFTRLNGISIVAFVVGLCILLEWAFNKTNSDLHSQIWDDKEGVNPITGVLILVLGCVYVGSSYWGTPYAVQYFAAAPNYHDMELLVLKHNNIIKQDTSVKNKDIAAAQLSADNFLLAQGKKDCKECPWRIRSGSSTAHKKKEAKVDSFGMVKGVSLAALIVEKKEKINWAKLENKEMKAKFDKWCSSLGDNFALLSVLFVFIFLLSFAWCQWYIRFEYDENETILSHKEPSKDERTEVKSVKTKEVVKNEDAVIGEVKTTNMQEVFAKSKENTVEPIDGKEYIWHRMKAGKRKNKLVKKTKRDYQLLINGCSRPQTKLDMKELLKQFT